MGLCLIRHHLYHYYEQQEVPCALQKKKDFSHVFLKQRIDLDMSPNDPVNLIFKLLFEFLQRVTREICVTVQLV